VLLLLVLVLALVLLLQAEFACHGTVDDQV
jgi:hypothetical protein